MFWHCIQTCTMYCVVEKLDWRTLNVLLSLMRSLKSRKFAYLMLKLCFFFLGSAHVLFVWSRPENDRRVSQNVILLERILGESPFVTQKSTRSGRIFLSDGQYIGSPIGRCFKLFLSIVLSSSRPLGAMSLDPQSECFSKPPPAMNRRPREL
jgi:hypothetical protein